MRFLVTNDDGIGAPGLDLLARVAADFGEVHVVAPAREQSGISHRVTFAKPLLVSQLSDGVHSVDGTPADCVRVAIATSKMAFDWVLAGINDGANLGIDVFYSGTVAAAREATFFGLNAIAFSQYRQHYNQPFDWTATEPLVRQVLAMQLSKSPTSQLANINLPDLCGSEQDADVAVVECDVDPSPLPPNFQQTNNGLLTTTRYAQRPRKSCHDIDVCFGGNISISYL
jgi:5'-nucleotidase